MIIDLERLLGQEKCARLCGAGLHLHRTFAKTAADEGLPAPAEINLKTAMQLIFTRMFLKRAEWRTIANGLQAVQDVENEQV